MKRPLAYITAPWSNSQYENAENAAAYCRQVYDAGYSPICPVLFLPTFLKDDIPQEHKDGLDMARDYLRRSHVLVVCGHGIDETVKNDIATAERLRITATTLDGIPPSSWAVKSRLPSKSWPPCWARKPLTPTTPARTVGGKPPTLSTIRSSAKICHNSW